MYGKRLGSAIESNKALESAYKNLAISIVIDSAREWNSIVDADRESWDAARYAEAYGTMLSIHNFLASQWGDMLCLSVASHKVMKMLLDAYEESGLKQEFKEMGFDDDRLFHLRDGKEKVGRDESRSL